MQKRLKDYLTDESGVAAIEYALITAMVALAIIPAATATGLALQATFRRVAEVLR